MRRLRVLGPLEVDGAAGALGPRDRVVVSALTLRPGERVDAETLAEALWGEQPPASAAKVVQGCVSRLRKTLGADAIETVDGGYRVPPDELDIDRQQFEAQVERARGYLATRTPERAIPLLTDALALWRGPAFVELEDWMPGRLEAVRLGQLRLAAEEDLLQARLDCGEHADVATDGTVLAGQQPFRERRWALLALAQYRSGRQADALASIRSARRALGQELGLDPGSELVALESSILAQDPGLGTDHEARLADAFCPWKGLAPYGDRDADTFFGRDADIAACLARLEQSPLLVVTGPSGSGKSSLVQAGLVPALRASGRDVEVFTPGSDGALAMAAARSRGAGDALLVIDQFEETFTLRGSAFARPWLGDLARYAQESAPVVLVVRGDHVADLGADPELARLAERGLHLVTPLTGERLREAVESPARVAGLRWEPGLVDLVVRDADEQPGALPLVSHALAETWRRREGGLLTVDGYRAAGGISDAVAASAERLYDGLSPDERGELRWLMLHLVSLSESGEAFRTPLPASVVPSLSGMRRRLLDLLVRGRLVTSADGGYDLAHEALVRAWPRLREWLDEDRVGQQIRRHLAMTAAGWEALDRADTELYRGSRLAAALDWLQRGHEPLTATERAFIEASSEEAQRVTHAQRRTNQRLRSLLVGLVALLVLALVGGFIALTQRQQARHAATAALAQSLGSQALTQPRPDVALLLAQQAVNLDPTPQTMGALFSTLIRASALVGSFPLDSPGKPDMISMSPDGRSLAVHDSEENVRFYDTRTHRVTSPHVNITPTLSVLGTWTGPHHYAYIDGEPNLETWNFTIVDAQSGSPVRTIRAGPVATRLSEHQRLDYQAQLFAISERSGLYFAFNDVDRATGAALQSYVEHVDLRSGQSTDIPIPGRGMISARQTGPHRITVVTDTTVDTLNVDTLRVRSSRRLHGLPSRGYGVVSPNGRLLVYEPDTVHAIPGEQFREVNLVTGRLNPTTASQGGTVQRLAFTPDSSRIVASDAFHTVVWNAATMEPLETFDSNSANIDDQAVSPDGRTLWTANDTGTAGTITEWDLDGSRRFGHQFRTPTGTRFAPQQAAPLAVSPDGSRAVASAFADTATIVSTADASSQVTLEQPGSSYPGSGVGPDGRPGTALIGTVAWSSRNRVATGSVAGVTLWNPDRPTSPIETLRTSGGVPVASEFSPDGRLLAVLTSTSGALVSGSARPTTPARFSRLNVFDTITGRRLIDKTLLGTGVGDVGFSPDGRSLAVGVAQSPDDRGHLGAYYALDIIDPQTGRERRMLASDTLAGFTALTYVSAHELIAGGVDGSVRRWDPTTGHAIGDDISVGAPPIASLTADASASTFAVTDGTTSGTSIWSTESATRLSSIPSSMPWGSAAYVGEDRILVTLEADGTGSVWPMRLATWTRHACSVVGRNLTTGEWRRFLPGRPYQRTCPELPDGR